MTQGFYGFLLVLGGGGDFPEGAGCMAGNGPGFRRGLFGLEINM